MEGDKLGYTARHLARLDAAAAQELRDDRNMGNMHRDMGNNASCLCSRLWITRGEQFGAQNFRLFAGGATLTF